MTRISAPLWRGWLISKFDWRQDPKFEINHPRHKGAEILVTGKNFGCGSSREHAAWALNDHGFRVVIAPSFADIFHSNAGKNGILLITLPEDQVEYIILKARESDTRNPDSYTLTISLEENTVSDNGGWSTTFHIDPFRRYYLLEGLDDIGLTLRHANPLDEFETGPPYQRAIAEHPEVAFGKFCFWEGDA